MSFTLLLKNLNSIIIATILTGASYFTAMQMGWIDSLNWLEIVAVWTSYVCTILCVAESRSNYVWGAVSVVLLSILFWEQKLMSSAILNAYLFPTLIWGWYRWKPDHDPRPVSWVDLNWWPVYLAATMTVWFALSHISDRLGATLAGPDSFILVSSILAQFLLDQKKLENWFVWMAVNIFSIYTYFEAGLYLVAFQSVFFLINNFVGIYFWFRSMTKLKDVTL